MSEFQALTDAFIALDQDEVEKIIDSLLTQKKTPLQIAEIARQAIITIGDMFEKKEIFLTELIMAGEIFKEIMNRLGFNANSASQNQIPTKGKILLATVQGDIHDIGKNIVSGLLISNGYEVIDVGVDVSPEKLISAIIQNKPKVVGLSGLLTAAYQSMKVSVDAINQKGLRNEIKIMIGGGSVDKSVCDYVGADGFGQNAVDAITLANKWIGK